SETIAREVSITIKALQAVQRRTFHTPRTKTGAILKAILKSYFFKSKVAVFTTREPVNNIREREKRKMEISADSIKFMQEKILNIHPIGCYKGQMAASGFISIRRCYVIHKVLSEQIAQASICLESARLQLLRQLVLAITFEGSARRCQVYFHRYSPTCYDQGHYNMDSGLSMAIEPKRSFVQFEHFILIRAVRALFSNVR
ncbi:hypothetical protein AB4K20DRAFT_2018152, partial [Rhizopus microsporus]